MPAGLLSELELDLDCFNGPFDLLVALVLREELELAEVELAEVVLAYVEVLERRGELDLEAATEFLVLIAALLELKSRLLLGGEQADEELEQLAPQEAADELLARMLQYLRYRGVAGWLTQRAEAGSGHLYRSAPLPPALRQIALDATPSGALDPAELGQAIGRLLHTPPGIELGHMRAPRITVGERLELLRELLRAPGGTFAFDDAVHGADAQTVCVTLWALLELYRQGEAGWQQSEPFGPITVSRA